MDFLCELIFDLILEGLFGLTVSNPKCKTWTKTGFFLLISEALAGFLLFSGIRHLQNGNTEGGTVITLMGAALGIGFAFSAVWGHRRNWKQAGNR